MTMTLQEKENLAYLAGDTEKAEILADLIQLNKFCEAQEARIEELECECTALRREIQALLDRLE